MVAFGRPGCAASGDWYSPARRAIPGSVVAADVDDEGPILVGPAFRTGQSAGVFRNCGVGESGCGHMPENSRRNPNETTRFGHFEDHCASPETRARPECVADRGGEREPSRGLRHRLDEMPGGVDPVPVRPVWRRRCVGEWLWGHRGLSAEDPGGRLSGIR